MQVIGRTISWGGRLTAAVAGVAVLAMVLHVTADVVLRFGFNAPIPGTILMVSTFYMTAVTFLPLALSEERNAHIAVEVIYDLTNSLVQRVLDVIGYCLSIIVFAALTLRTWEEAMAKFDIGASTVETGVRIMTWPSYFLLPIGFGLMLLMLVRKLVRVLTAPRRDASPKVDETHAPYTAE